MVVGFITTYANQCLSSLKLWVRTPLRRGVLDTKLCDKIFQWLLMVFSRYSGFLHQYKWPTGYNWNIVSCVKYHKTKPSHNRHFSDSIWLWSNLINAWTYISFLLIYWCYKFGLKLIYFSYLEHIFWFNYLCHKCLMCYWDKKRLVMIDFTPLSCFLTILFRPFSCSQRFKNYLAFKYSGFEPSVPDECYSRNAS